MTIIPFRPWLPAPDQAQAVVSPPFDVPTRVEAAAMAQGDRRNFLHVVRADVDLPNDLPAHLLRAELKVTDGALAAAGVEEMLKRHRGIAGASLRAATRRSARFGHGEPGRRSLGAGWRPPVVRIEAVDARRAVGRARNSRAMRENPRG